MFLNVEGIPFKSIYRNEYIFGLNSKTIGVYCE